MLNLLVSDYPTITEIWFPLGTFRLMHWQKDG